MGCGASAPPPEKYRFHYTGDAGHEEFDEKRKAETDASAAQVSGRKDSFKAGDGKIHAAEPEAPASTPASVGAAASKMKRKVSAKDRFKNAKNATKTAAAFSSAGKQRSKRNKGPHGWIAKDMLLGKASLDKFEPKRVIGTGLMGTVQLAMFKKDETWCAIKMIKKDYVCRHNDGRHIKAERALLNACDSPFIVNLFGTFQDKKFV
jgi:hypothetical protein